MNVYEFYKKGSDCPKKTMLESLSAGEERYVLLRKVLKMVCGSIGAGMKNEAIMGTVTSFFKDAYKDKVFTFSWQKEKQAENDILLFRRFLDWISDSGFTVVKSFSLAQVSFPDVLFADGTDTLSVMVPLVMTDTQGKYHGLIIHVTNATRSMAGKSILTHAACDLYALVAKYALEDVYNGIEIDSIYLSTGNDTPEKMLDSFVENKTAKSNVHRLCYADYYSGEGIFDKEKFFAQLLKVIKVTPEFSCEKCQVYSLCSTPSVFSTECEESTNEVVSTYNMPSFTETQQHVISHKEGPLLVCAGPGSGKTATIIGRIRHLIETGVEPEFILVVTFTNEAADELRQRCLSFLSEDALPKIATLNSFCYGILKENKAKFGRALKVLSGEIRTELIKSMAAVFPELKGFKYGMEYGANGLYNTIANRIEYYRKCCNEGNEENFFEKYPMLGDDFIEFARQYFLCVEAQGYITFDEQIQMCNQLFKDYPEVLSMYQNIYQYIMVDEYQDVNADQVEMLYLLAAKHHNLVVVGDDDQGIYGFRGGDASFMLNFQKDFPEAQIVVLSDNFRSTGALVSAADALIRNNVNRISKDIRSSSANQKNVLPVLIGDDSVDSIEYLVSDLCSRYNYEDIAILATKNATLNNLHKVLSAPTVLGKSYLINDAFFILVYTTLQLWKDFNNDKAFYQFMKLHGIDNVERIEGLSLFYSLLNQMGIEFSSVMENKLSHPAYDAICQLYVYYNLIENGGSPKEIIENMAATCNWMGSDSVSVLMEEIDNNQLNDKVEFLDWMERMVICEAEKRVKIEHDGSILLITSHDAKGREFKVVLLINDFTNGGEEGRRLFYVALTRAKEEFYLFQSAGCSTDFIREIPHTTMEVAYGKEESDM